MPACRSPDPDDTGSAADSRTPGGEQDVPAKYPRVAKRVVDPAHGVVAYVEAGTAVVVAEQSRPSGMELAEAVSRNLNRVTAGQECLGQRGLPRSGDASQDGESGHRGGRPVNEQAADVLPHLLVFLGREDVLPGIERRGHRLPSTTARATGASSSTRRCTSSGVCRWRSRRSWAQRSRSAARRGAVAGSWSAPCPVRRASAADHPASWLRMARRESSSEAWL